MVIAYVAVEKTAFCYDRLFKYVIPEDLALKAKVGSFVVVPFGLKNSLRQAVVFKIELEKKKSLG